MSNDPACRLRSILAGTPSLTLRTAGHRADLVGRHSVDAAGRLRLDLPADSRLAADVARHGEAVAVVEVTDLAPTPVRDRVRARATLGGWLTPEHTGGTDLTVHLDLATADLTADGSTATVDPAAVAAAAPDPLAAEEAGLLCHLDRHHPRTVKRLCRLVDPRHRQGVRRVVPVRLDRYGIVLRLERAGGHRDARLAFAPALDHPDELGCRMGALLDRAASCRRLTSRP